MKIEGTLNYPQEGIKIEPLFNDGRDVTIVYDGLLHRSGADQVYLHAGYGTNWQKSYDHRMEKSQEGWKCTINMEREDLVFCFKDSACNWDNNSGNNWVYRSQGTNRR
ncbi:carbohydrate-binding protein [Heliorestis convoluta]|uniref:Carbohydrate binding domain (Family 25), putative n=1 Tax=Heliorestis convoluta TaxID=356322 RepID=A0A5Q2N0H0_9FIRM|nr:carbohydrate-binding protein [Heliorestis convoluta]QGG46752.1 Carbohydrate binding domain (Family 25), putative [Heliorestis convoluta]